ncbi:hypothetical protein M9H77_07128 [Catharanthus roseus]|uniref:Uncharacterized protein n=1 Tax=Catharanthus roseus TaxID=4058 RepID=A0ACC0BU19_CATRO|nr:hypothetical protein M9H77_07128 [Catharanthus roseus]
MDALFYTARQAYRQETARAARLEMELAQIREAYVAQEREILELIHERDWLRRFLTKFFSTARNSVDRACDKLESRPGYFGSQCHQAENMSGSQSPNHTDEAMSDSSQNRHSEPIREATPCPKQATHKFYGEVEEEIKAEPFLEQLNDIYYTLKYEDALRVMFAAFTLRGMAKDWWLRASEARTLKNQP